MNSKYTYILLNRSIITNRQFSFLKCAKNKDHPTGRIEFFEYGNDSIIDSDCVLLYESMHQRHDELPLFSIYKKQNRLIVNYPAVVTFLIVSEQFDIEVYINDLSWKKVEMILFGTILSIVSEVNGLLCFHASTVTYNNNSIMLVGEAGAGKTTLTTALALTKEFKLLADDMVAVDLSNNEIQLFPTQSQVRLWPDSVDALFLNHNSYPVAYEGTNKRSVSLEDNFNTSPGNLVRIYFIKRTLLNEDQKIDIQRKTARDTLLGLVRYSFAGRLIAKLGMQKNRLPLMSSIAGVIPARNIIYPQGYKYLPQVVESIRQDLQHQS